MLKSLNASFLALIPKIDGANRLDQFRPIALCNVTYKIITKLIVERLKPFLANLISEEQGGFVGGRQILDGWLLLQRLFTLWPHPRKRLCLLS